MKKFKFICLFVFFLYIQASTFNVALELGWNLISTPIDTVEFDDWDIVGNAFIYDPTIPGYEDASVLVSGTGYWVMSRTYQTIPISGDMDSCITPSIKRGWNMAGVEETKGAIIGLV